MNALGKLLLWGSAGFLLWKGVEGYQKRVAEADAKARALADASVARQALEAKASADPFALSPQEIAALGPEFLGQLIANLTQEQRTRFAAHSQGQSYAAPDQPGLADPNFVGPPDLRS